MAPAARAQAIGLPQLSEISAECVECHKKQSLGLYQMWGSSKHYRANVGCYECHRAEPGDPDAFEHDDFLISVIVSPKDCGKCHPQETAEQEASHHSKAGDILNTKDGLLGQTIGFDLGVNEDVNGGPRDAQLMMFGGDQNFNRLLNADKSTRNTFKTVTRNMASAV
jgi:hypothetical protein